MFDAVIKSYKKELLADRKKECEDVLRKFEEIRMRGRKRTMVG
jgi:tRNA A-37 threonylcarbamoyl transferase component Bud32